MMGLIKIFRSVFWTHQNKLLQISLSTVYAIFSCNTYYAKYRRTTCIIYIYCPLSSGETDTSKFWDSKGRGGNGGQTGELFWDLHDIAHNFTDGRFVVISFVHTCTCLCKILNVF